MIGYRKLAALAAAGAVPLLLSPLVAAPASAHGAMQNPVSRVAACGPIGGSAKSAACKAAIAVSGAQAFAAWDNLRVAGVDGRDRQTIPDGKLCSGGKPEYAGLDLPRTDWPATRLAAGASFTFRYRTTIAHQGTFRLYVTTGGYAAAKPLTWSVLERQPFLTVTDPPVTDGAYTFRGKLPGNRTGRQLIYTIWQNAGPDTYYSCSDVVFTGPGGAVASTGSGSGSTGAGKATKAPARKPTATGAPAPSADQGVGLIGSAEPVSRSEPLAAATRAGNAIPLVVGGAAVLAAAAALAALLRRRRRADRP
jgi:chitin-binding protein